MELGIVERREAPPSALFALVREHLAARALLDIAGARAGVLGEMDRVAGEMSIPPLSVVVFGSLARSEADRVSDIDVVIVRPEAIEDDDDAWSASVEQWRTDVARASGNRVEVVEVGPEELAHRLRGRAPLWRDFRRDGIVVHGRPLTEVAEAVVG